LREAVSLVVKVVSEETC